MHDNAQLRPEKRQRTVKNQGAEDCGNENAEAVDAPTEVNIFKTEILEGRTRERKQTTFFTPPDPDQEAEREVQQQQAHSPQKVRRERPKPLPQLLPQQSTEYPCAHCGKATSMYARKH